MTDSINPSLPPKPHHRLSQAFLPEKLEEAKQVYHQVMKEINAPVNSCHAEVGILARDGTALPPHSLGLDEPYGAHRAGSVTKTFTAFLALKLCNQGVFPKGLNTRLGDFVPHDISEETIKRLFDDPSAAKKMTLDQLLSHTAGIEAGDHCCEE